MHARRVFILAVTLVLTSATGLVVAQRNNDKNQQKSQRPPQEQQDAQTLVTLVDTMLMADMGITMPAPGAPQPAAPVTPKPLIIGAPDRTEGGIPVKWESNYFVKGPGGETYIPFTISLDKSKVATGAALFIRVVNSEEAAAFGTAIAMLATPPQGNKPPAAPARLTYSWENLHFLDVPDDGKLSRAIQLKPGQYVVFVAVKEKSPAPANQRNDRNRNDRNAAPPSAVPAVTGLLRHEITVPDYNVSGLRTSSIVLAQSIEPLDAPIPADQQESNPYVFGVGRITPSFDGKFSKGGVLNVFFFIYGAKEAASSKPDLVVDFSFYQRSSEGEKYFIKTQPRPQNAETLPPQFSLSAGHQLFELIGIPLTSFQSGDYRLEVKVTDKSSGTEMTQSVNFTVLPV